ncbi:hypothetical protein CEE37_10410 [candidate division LCP-89 bacterium B3_LCP]|uniref:Outer membrane protein beta-barrel domain-containing protein n=1 Tax=candidate division LCP-89 bacterium B3_LCP TaxID=2012998 RepID=A0A532UXL6_UNCL8|nr:MAG: hypothetical protein CEE37_10410 [candidate division LCP-89 bacterium B3_LCP]
MKTILIITLTIIVISSPVGAAWNSFQGGAGGFSFYIVKPDLGPLNTELKALGMPQFDGYMFLYGGQGFGYVSNSLRIGGMGFGGSVSVNDIENGYAREAIFSMGWGGILIEYLMLEVSNFELFTGGTLGWGSVSVSLRKTDSPVSWGEIWNNYTSQTGSGDSISSELSHSFFMIQPRVGVKYYLLDWLAVGGSIDVPILNLSSSGWSINGDNIYDAPSLDLTQPFFQFSILVGG